MAMVTPPPPGGRVTPSPLGPFVHGVPKVLVLIAIVPLLALAVGCYYWFAQRIEVPAGKVLVLLHKVGEALPVEADGQVILSPSLLQSLGEDPDSLRFKGIIYDVLPEGRYFFDPFFWRRDLVDAIIIEQNEVGIKIRKYGKSLPPGKIVATEPDERGPLTEVLKPARYNINPHAYEIRRVKPVFIPEGYVGIQILYSGEDPEDPNVYVVKPGERGVQPDVLPPGMYYNNPYVRKIEQIEVRTQTLDLLGDDAIRFPSNDSFEIVVEGTIQYAVRLDKVAYVRSAFGDHRAIRDSLIMPYANSLSRIEGSKLLAKEFISGESRIEFQKQVFEGLSELCYEQGIEIQEVRYRDIVPPAAIAGPISDRQIAIQQITQYESEIKLAESEARLAEQEEMQAQNLAVGEANREVVTLTVDAEQKKAVALTEANKRLAVAKLQLEAARETAQALLSRGKAEAEVVLLKYEAEARPLADAVAAFGDGSTYAQYFFYQKLGPALKSVLASTEGPFAEIFRSLSKPPPESAAAGGQAGVNGVQP